MFYLLVDKTSVNGKSTNDLRPYVSKYPDTLSQVTQNFRKTLLQAWGDQERLYRGDQEKWVLKDEKEEQWYFRKKRE